MNKYLEAIKLKARTDALIKEVADLPEELSGKKSLTKELKEFSEMLAADISNGRAACEEEVKNIAIETLKMRPDVSVPQEGKYAEKAVVYIKANFDERLDYDTIESIMAEPAPIDAFSKLIESRFAAQKDKEKNELRATVYAAVLDKHGDCGDGDIVEVIIDSVIEKNVVFKYPYEDFLRQEVCVPILVDAGDSEFNYTINRLMPPDAEHPRPWVHPKSSILWLFNQQGFSEEVLSARLQHKCSPAPTASILSKLCATVQGFSNTPYDTSPRQLLFLTSQNIKELLLLNTAMKQGVGSISINRAFFGLLNLNDYSSDIAKMNELDGDIIMPTAIIESATCFTTRAGNPKYKAIQETLSTGASQWGGRVFVYAPTDICEQIEAIRT